MQVALVQASGKEASSDAAPGPLQEKPSDYTTEQVKDPDLQEMIEFLSYGKMPQDSMKAKKLAVRETMFTLVGGIHYYVIIVERNGGELRSLVTYLRR